MKTYAIVIKDSEVSEFGYTNLLNSSQKVKNDFEVNRFDAIVPKDVDKLLMIYGLKWNYPWSGEVIDMQSGLAKRAYTTANPKARIACALSHYTLWKKASMIDEPILIMEHDAYFQNKIDFDPSECKGNIIGINNPLGCTRRANLYYESILSKQDKFQLAPYIDDKQIPQGLAGNSSYIINRKGAEDMLKLVDVYGLWPNDALMCRQLVQGLYVTRKFYTHIQNLKSTTTL